MTILIIFLLSFPAQAVTVEQHLPDPAQERQAQEIFRQLKCVVCEGQALAESDAALAAQMRAQVRRMVAEKKSAPEILAFFAERYGESVLLTPPLKTSTYALWLAPFTLLLLGGAFVWRITRTHDKDRA